MANSDIKLPGQNEKYSINATFISKEKRYNNIPCKIYLPERIFEKPLVVIGPLKEFDKELLKQFKGSLKADFSHVIGREEPRTYIESPEVYFSQRQTKHNAPSPVSTMKGEPQNLHIVENLQRSENKSTENHLTFWLTPNSYLTPSVSVETHYSGDIKHERVQKIEFLIKNGIKLSFDKHFRTKSLDNGDRLQWSHLVANTKIAISVEEVELIQKTILKDIDDFLLLVSFVSRQHTGCLGWSGYNDDCITTFYRGNYGFPESRKKHSSVDGVIENFNLKDFIEKCYPVFLRFQTKQHFRNALYAIVPSKSGTLESSYLKIFAGLEALILDFRRKDNLEHIISEPDDWKKLRKYLKKCIKSSADPYLSAETRSLIYPKLSELNRVSIRQAFDLFYEKFRIELDDLWPVFGDKNSVGLVDIRNKLIHGDSFPQPLFRDLMVAHEHLKYSFERIALRILGWDVTDSNISPEYLKTGYTAIIDLKKSVANLNDFINKGCFDAHNGTTQINDQERSYELIEQSDLSNLLDLARSDIKTFFINNAKYIDQYENKEALVVLAQGGASHYTDHVNGIKDFDVWFFYPKHDGLTLPYRRRGIVDFGASKFGKHPDDIGFKGRRIDVLMRSDISFVEKIPEAGLDVYLSNGKTNTAKLLAQKAVIGLWPSRLFGKVLWTSDRNKE